MLFYVIMVSNGLHQIIATYEESNAIRIIKAKATFISCLNFPMLVELLKLWRQPTKKYHETVHLLAVAGRDIALWDRDLGDMERAL